MHLAVDAVGAHGTRQLSTASGSIAADGVVAGQSDQRQRGAYRTVDIVRILENRSHNVAVRQHGRGGVGVSQVGRVGAVHAWDVHGLRQMLSGVDSTLH